MTELSLQTLVTRVGDLRFAPVDDEIVILNTAKSNYVGLDDIGRRIWEILEKPIRVDQLLHQITQDYAGDRETIARDLLDFLGELYDPNLIMAIESDGVGSGPAVP